MAPPCRELVSTGECSYEDDCSYNHDLPFCSTCERYFDSLGNYRQHVAGAAHRQRVEALSSEAIALPDGKIQCSCCGSKLQFDAWQRHVKSPKHVSKVRFRRAQDAKAAAESDKGIVQLSPPGDIDFGLVEFEEMTAQTANHQRVETVKIEVGEMGIVLEGVEFQEKPEANAGHRHFSVQRFSEPVKIPANRHRNVSIHFQPRNDIGSYEDVLIFNFTTAPRKGRQQETFSIHRTVRGSVGVKDDITNFSAQKPYEKPDLQNRPRADKNKTVAAPKDEYVQNVPWTGKLPWFATPRWLVTLIEKTTIGERIKQLGSDLGTLSHRNYSKYWSTLLYLESYDEELNVRRYDINNTTLKKTGSGQYYLDVDGLAEKRPSVLRSDKVKIQIRTSSDKRWFEGIVTVVEESRVLLKFNKAFKPEANARFDVQFSISRIPVRRQLQALHAPLPRSHLLFPTLDTRLNAAFPPQDHPKFFSKAIESNRAQREAVVSIFNNTSGDAPYVVFGPPGTGKTVTIIEACQQLVTYLDATILLAAPSNSAADLLCSRLNLPKEVIFRLNAPSRMTDAVPQAIAHLCCIEDGSFACPELGKLSQYRVIVSTCISASILRGIGLREGHFSHIFIDEAGQATEPEAFLPLSLAAEGTNVVLAGDPKQLGPIVHSTVSARFGLDISFLERIMSYRQYDQTSFEYRGVTYSKLIQNYRNHRAILSTSNQEFYANELVICAPPSITASLREWDVWPNRDFPIIFHSVKGRDEREGSSPSFFNVAEISMIRHYVESLKKSKKVKLLDSDIGIISPYAAQCSKLRTALKAHERPKLTIGSVEQFQGSERSVILMSTVRSNKEFLEQDKRCAIGFLESQKRFNVAITRPQAGLIIVGDPDILSLDPLWRRFLVYVHKNGGWRGQEWDPTPFEDATFDPVQAARQNLSNLISLFSALEGLGMDD